MAVQDLNAIAFPTLSDEQMAKLGSYSGQPLKRFRAGQALFHCSEHDSKFFVVRSGKVEILDITM